MGSERPVAASETPAVGSESPVPAPESTAASSENTPDSSERQGFKLRGKDKGEQKRIEYPDSDYGAPIDHIPEGRNARYEYLMEHMLAAIRKGRTYTEGEILRETLRRLRAKDRIRLTKKWRENLEPVLKKAIRDGYIEKTAWVDEYWKG